MPKAYLRFITAMLIFGSVGLFVKAIPLPAAQIVLARTVVGGLVLGGIYLWKKQRTDRALWRKNALILLLSGSFLGLNWLFLFLAYQNTTVSLATILYYMAPMIVIALSPFVLGEKLTRQKLFALLAAMIGLILITNTASGGGSFKGVLYGLTSAFFYAGLMLLNKKIKGMDALSTTLAQLIPAAIIMTTYVLVADLWSPLGELSPKTLFLLLFVGMVHTGLACYLFFGGIAQIPAQSAALLSYMDPLSALIFSAVLLGERLTGLQLLGALLILGGAVLGEWRFKKIRPQK